MSRPSASDWMFGFVLIGIFDVLFFGSIVVIAKLLVRILILW
jgi:hypothetical protein